MFFNKSQLYQLILLHRRTKKLSFPSNLEQVFSPARYSTIVLVCLLLDLLSNVKSNTCGRYLRLCVCPCWPICNTLHPNLLLWMVFKGDSLDRQSPLHSLKTVFLPTVLIFSSSQVSVSFYALPGILSACETLFGPKPVSLSWEINVGGEQYLTQVLWVG